MQAAKFVIASALFLGACAESGAAPPVDDSKASKDDSELSSDDPKSSKSAVSCFDVPSSLSLKGKVAFGLIQAEGSLSGHPSAQISISIDGTEDFKTIPAGSKLSLVRPETREDDSEGSIVISDRGPSYSDQRFLITHQGTMKVVSVTPTKVTGYAEDLEMVEFTVSSALKSELRFDRCVEKVPRIDFSITLE